MLKLFRMSHDHVHELECSVEFLLVVPTTAMEDGSDFQPSKRFASLLGHEEQPEDSRRFIPNKTESSNKWAKRNFDQ